MSAKLPKILLFDDDAANLKLYQHMFKDDFSVQGSQNPHTYQKTLDEDVAAILVDVLMPSMSGTELFAKLKADQRYNGCPILFISASESDEVMVKALDTGGDDFLRRTMKKEELILRIKSKIEYSRTHRQLYVLGTARINLNEFKAYLSHELLDLTLIEFKIMKLLLREFPRFTAREDINQEVWADQTVLPTTLNTHLSNLRSKFGDWDYEIVHVKPKGVGLRQKEC